MPGLRVNYMPKASCSPLNVDEGGTHNVDDGGSRTMTPSTELSMTSSSNMAVLLVLSTP